jgi:hypothetical protein
MGITYVTTDQEGRHGHRLGSQSGMFLWEGATSLKRARQPVNRHETTRSYWYPQASRQTVLTM